MAWRSRAPAQALPPGSQSGAYAYVLCDMEFDGKRVADVGLRFKGNSSYSVSSTTLRRPMKLDFDRFGYAFEESEVSVIKARRRVSFHTLSMGFSPAL